MAYNYGAPPGAFGGRQPSYGAPGMAPPGMDAPAAAAQAQFNIPGVNLHAPVIRLGMDQNAGPPVSDRDRDRGVRDGRGGNAEYAGGNTRRAGLGADGGSRNLERDRAQIRENMLAIQPPTREEVARTITVSGMGDDAPASYVAGLELGTLTTRSASSASRSTKTSTPSRPPTSCSAKASRCLPSRPGS
jgi:hypothetical protein